MQIVKIRHTAVISHAMIMMAVTAKAAAVVVAVKTVMTAPMIGRLMVLNAVIVPGMNMALIALHLKVHMAGIVQVVNALVIRLVNVVMAPAM